MLAQYEEKMKKSVEALLEDYKTKNTAQSVPDVRIHIFWIVSQYFIMEHLHHCSRWQISQFQKQERL